MALYELWLGVIGFGVTVWLGLYLIGRNPMGLLGWFAGMSALSAAFAMMIAVIENYAPAIRLAQDMVRWRQLAVIFAVLFWFLFLVRLTPSERRMRERFEELPRTMQLMLVGSLLFSLWLIIIFFPFGVTTFWSILGICAILWLLGSTAVFTITHDQQEAFWPDFVRSFDYAFFMALLFGGQIGLVMAWATGVNFVMLNLLFGVVATAVFVQAFAMRFASFVDQIAFFTFPAIRQERAALRASSDAVARVDPTLDLLDMPQEAFIKLTRRTLSEMGNLPKLTANPLTQLPLIQTRLAEKGTPIHTLAQANELKQLLRESIERMKPYGDDEFGTTDEWRHYNALYFPYVVGIRPYRRYATSDNLTPAERDALAWFRAEVPPRTLYNWQNAAAKLIARDLRERSVRLRTARMIRD